MLAIQNIKTGKFVYGTDYRHYPPHQRTSYDQMLTYENLFFAENDFKKRRCGKDYRIVLLEPVKVHEIINLSDSD